jgi:hypothetical protein
MSRALWLPSASKMAQALACPGSVVLPRDKRREEATPEMLRGSAIHLWLEKALGPAPEPPATALDVADAALVRFCKENGLDAGEIAQTIDGVDLSDIVREGATVLGREVAYAYDVEAGTARELGSSIERRYLQAGWVPTREIAGTADLLLRLIDGSLLVADFKSAHFDTANSPSWDAQLNTLALAVARVHGVDSISVGVCLILEDGRTSWRTRQLDALDLDCWAVTLEVGLARWREAHAAVSQGQAPATTPGHYCTWCPSRPVCPSWTQLARELARDPQLDPAAVSLLTPEAAGRAYVKSKLLRKLLDDIDAQLDARAHLGALPLPGGGLYGWVEEKRETLTPEVVERVVAQLLSPEAAALAVKAERKATKTALEEMATWVAREKKAAGEKVSAAGIVRAVLAEVEKQGGLKRSTFSRPKEFGKGKGE